MFGFCDKDLTWDYVFELCWCGRVVSFGLMFESILF